MAKRKEPLKEARLEGKINRLLKEIQLIEERFYASNDNNLEQRYFMLERKRDDTVRSLVLQLHTAIEDLLACLLRNNLLGITTEEWPVYSKRHRVPARLINEVVASGRSISFENKLKLLRGLKILRKGTYDNLFKLNELRNKCSHNWLLNVHIRKGIKPGLPKRPLLQFKNKSLYDPNSLEDFASIYGQIYIRLFMKTL